MAKFTRLLILRIYIFPCMEHQLTHFSLPYRILCIVYWNSPILLLMTFVSTSMIRKAAPMSILELDCSLLRSMDISNFIKQCPVVLSKSAILSHSQVIFSWEVVGAFGYLGFWWRKCWDWGYRLVWPHLSFYLGAGDPTQVLLPTEPPHQCPTLFFF